MKFNRILFFLTLLTLLSFLSEAQRFEAENAQLTGGAVVTAVDSLSGGKMVEMRGGNLLFTINLTEEAFYHIYLRAAAPGGKKINSFSVDGSTVDFTVEQNANYVLLKVVSSYKLSAGNHTLKISNSWGYINIDYIQLETTDPASRFNVKKALVTPNPMENTSRLYNFLYDNYGKKIISGAMTLRSMDEINWLKSNTGKEPALVGLDFMFCGRNYSWYPDDEPVNDAKNYYSRNGIPAFCWHWRDPSRKTEAFYTKDTSFDISKITDVNSTEYKAMVADIDYIAGLLKKLQDAGVPVLWRPLHEASGGWFWWGAKGAEPCKKLWVLMFDRLVNYHGLKNLIWVWTSQQDDKHWYPGDEYVDIIGRDIYKEGDHSSQIMEFNKLNDDYGGNKLVTLSECGSFPDPDNVVNDRAAWSYYMPWYGDFVRSSKYNSLDLWKKAFAHPNVLTLDEMPDLKSYVSQPANTWRSKLYPENWQPGYNDGSGRFLHDFSYAGYHQGESEIPHISANIVDVTKAPYNADKSGKTDVTAILQSALDAVGVAGGGVVYLPAGTYMVNPGSGENALRIRYNNTILRGAGTDSTFIFNNNSYMRQKNIIYVMGDWATWSDAYGTTAKLSSDLLYPTRIIPVVSVSSFKKGDQIILQTDGTEAFVEEHGMAGIWTNTVARVMFHRTIDSIDVDNKLIYIDSPTRYFMKLRDNARVHHAKKHITECGIENLSIGNIQNDKPGWDEETYSTPGTGAYEVHASQAIYMKYALNCWVKKVNTYKPPVNTEDVHVLSNCLLLSMCRGVTVDSCFFQKSQYEGGGGNGYMYTLSANDCLIKNSRANHSRHNYDFKYPYSNGNVIHKCIAENSKYSSDFHMYLSMANLFDVTTVDKDYLESTFRPYGGTVLHGYSSTQSVFYNTKGLAYHSNKTYIIESKQFGHGYIIGTSGPANKVLLDPVQGTSGGYPYNTSPRDFTEGIGTGESLYPQSLYLDQLDRRLKSNGLPSYQVSVKVKHEFTGELLENCKVTLGNTQKITNSAGEAYFGKNNNLIILGIEKNSFYPLNNTQYFIYSDTVLNFNLTPREYKITIVPQDKKTGQTFEGVPVVFNGKTEVTNADGKVFFNAYEGNFLYSIVKNSYFNIESNISVFSDTIIFVPLTRSEAYIKFKLSENNVPVNLARVILSQDTLITGGLGIANFTGLSVNSTFNYKIYKGGYDDITGSIKLASDTTVYITMKPYATAVQNLPDDKKIRIWPNPASGFLCFSIPPDTENGWIEITSVKGEKIKKIQTKKTYEEFNITDIPPGMYMVKFISKSLKHSQLILKH